MKTIHRSILAVILFSLLSTSCSNSSTTTEEKTEINRMDTSSKTIKDKVGELENQTEKVENALEQLDKEFPDSTN